MNLFVSLNGVLEHSSYTAVYPGGILRKPFINDAVFILIVLLKTSGNAGCFVSWHQASNKSWMEPLQGPISSWWQKSKSVQIGQNVPCDHWQFM